MKKGTSSHGYGKEQLMLVDMWAFSVGSCKEQNGCVLLSTI